MADGDAAVEWADEDENPLPIWLEGDSLAPPCQADFDVVAACALRPLASRCRCIAAGAPPCRSGGACASRFSSALRSLPLLSLLPLLLLQYPPAGGGNVR